MYFIATTGTQDREYTINWTSKGAYREVKSNSFMDAVIDEVASVFGIPPESIKGKSKDRLTCDARHMVFYVARNISSITLKRIGESVSRHHTTVMFGIRSAQDKMDIDEDYRRKYVYIKFRLTSQGH